jgi:hypothetical protein
MDADCERERFFDFDLDLALPPDRGRNRPLESRWTLVRPPLPPLLVLVVRKVIEE